MRPRLALVPGEPAGIGPEVIDLALASAEIPPGLEIEVIGDRAAGTPGRPDGRSAAAALAALEESVRRLKDGSADAVQHSLLARFGGPTG